MLAMMLCYCFGLGLNYCFTKRAGVVVVVFGVLVSMLVLVVLYSEEVSSRPNTFYRSFLLSKGGGPPDLPCDGGFVLLSTLAKKT